MNMLLFYLIIIISLNEAYQLDCGEFDEISCGFFNKGFTNKCNLDSICKEVLIDSGCKIEGNSCVKQNNDNSKEICNFYDIPLTSRPKKMCKKVLID